MPALERRISLRGPRFWIDDGVLMFCNQLDSSTRDGPREATDEDRVRHADAYAAAFEGDEDPIKPMLSAIDPPHPPAPAPKPYAERRDRAS